VRLLNNYLSDAKSLYRQKQSLTKDQRKKLGSLQKAWRQIRERVSKLSDPLLKDWTEIVNDFVDLLVTKKSPKTFDSKVRQIHRRVIANYLSLCQFLHLEEQECVNKDDVELIQGLFQ
jgi:hypothetical protein